MPGELIFHLFSAIAGDVLLVLTGIVASLYLVRNRLLKSKRRMSLLGSFPSIKELDYLGIKLLGAAFVFLTLGSISGAYLASRFWGPRWFFDPRQVWSLVIWLVVALMLYARISKGWRGRRAAWYTIIVVLLTLGGFLGISNLPESKHQNFYTDRSLMPRGLQNYDR